MVRELLRGPHRFTELRDSLPGISPHPMTSGLRQFEAQGIVTRTTYAEIPHGSPRLAGVWPPAVRSRAEQAARDTASGLLLEAGY